MNGNIINVWLTSSRFGAGEIPNKAYGTISSHFQVKNLHKIRLDVTQSFWYAHTAFGFHHNRTPTSGGNVLIFMLPKHESEELRLLWWTGMKKKTGGEKSFLDSEVGVGVEEEGKKSPAESVYWKNILWMVYHLRKTIIWLSIPRPFSARKRVESGKFFSWNIHSNWVVLWRIRLHNAQQRDPKEISLEHKSNYKQVRLFFGVCSRQLVYLVE